MTHAEAHYSQLTRHSGSCKGHSLLSALQSIHELPEPSTRGQLKGRDCLSSAYRYAMSNRHERQAIVSDCCGHSKFHLHHWSQALASCSKSWDCLSAAHVMSERQATVPGGDDGWLLTQPRPHHPQPQLPGRWMQPAGSRWRPSELQPVQTLCPASRHRLRWR